MLRSAVSLRFDEDSPPRRRAPRKLMSGSETTLSSSDTPDDNDELVVPEDLVAKLKAGDPKALNQLFSTLFDDLTRSARRMLDRGARDQSKLQTGDLVNSGCRRVLAAGIDKWVNSQHVYRLACRAMRSALVDHIRKARIRPEASIDYVGDLLAPGKAGEIIALNDALEAFEEVSPDGVWLIELRYFGGLTMAEAAKVMNYSKRDAERLYTASRHWLKDRLA